MGQAFVTKNPSKDETNLLRLLLSCFRDGSGGNRENDGRTRPDWRQIERCFADFFRVKTSENKNIFDLIAIDDINRNINYGISVKSKQLSEKKILNKNRLERAYMEIANSPAKFFDALKSQFNIEERHFAEQKYPDIIGNCLIQTVESWHLIGKQEFEKNTSGKQLNIDQSKYVCLSYSNYNEGQDRLYIVHSFSLKYPKNIRWEYSAKRCLSGFDQLGDKIIDWYALSGGQLKFYPLFKDAVWKSDIFSLAEPPNFTGRDRIKSYFPSAAHVLEKKGLL